MTATPPGPRRRPWFRLTVQQQQLDGSDETVMDAQGDAFIAIVGTTTPQGRHQGEHSHGGPDHTVHDMAHIIANTHLDLPPR
ncbi:MAG: hypothetical protein M3276_05525 [Actinomycetota bacterium]|nr:hypothetical protein [Actinomycetota bacterium]